MDVDKKEAFSGFNGESAGAFFIIYFLIVSIMGLFLPFIIRAVTTASIRSGLLWGSLGVLLIFLLYASQFNILAAHFFMSLILLIVTYIAIDNILYAINDANQKLGKEPGRNGCKDK